MIHFKNLDELRQKLDLHGRDAVFYRLVSVRMWNPQRDIISLALVTKGARINEHQLKIAEKKL